MNFLYWIWYIVVLLDSSVPHAILLVLYCTSRGADDVDGEVVELLHKHASLHTTHNANAWTMTLISTYFCFIQNACHYFFITVKNCEQNRVTGWFSHSFGPKREHGSTTHHHHPITIMWNYRFFFIGLFYRLQFSSFFYHRFQYRLRRFFIKWISLLVSVIKFIVVDS